ncbi:MAG: hypothetical protein K2K83_07100, partial [Rikenella sp.]|nr:hypothetical protein [Rikenella sp.]
MKTNDPTTRRFGFRELFRSGIVWFVLLSLGLSTAAGRGTLPDSLAGRSQVAYASDEDYALIFNSYSETAPWSGQVIEAVTHQLEELSPQTLVLTHNLNSVLIHNRSDLNAMRRQMDSTYVRKPRMIVY